MQGHAKGIQGADMFLGEDFDAAVPFPHYPIKPTHLSGEFFELVNC